MMDLKVGDILVSSWGYDQTNIDFYQVVRMVGKASVSIRKIGQQSVQETGYMTGTCGPDPDNFIGEPFTKRIGERGIKIESFAYAYKWDGRPRRWSSYA